MRASASSPQQGPCEGNSTPDSRASCANYNGGGGRHSTCSSLGTPYTCLLIRRLGKVTGSSCTLPADLGIEEYSCPEDDKDTKGHIGSINLIRGNMGSMLRGRKPFAAFIVVPIMHRPLKYSRNREVVTKRRCPLQQH